MEEITVEFFNGLGKGTLTHGIVKPRTSIMMTSNLDCSDSARSVIIFGDITLVVIED